MQPLDDRGRRRTIARHLGALVLTAFVAFTVLVGGCGDTSSSDDQTAQQEAAAATKTFGKTGSGTTKTGCSADKKRASAFALTDANAKVTKLTAFLDGAGSG